MLQRPTRTGGPVLLAAAGAVVLAGCGGSQGASVAGIGPASTGTTTAGPPQGPAQIDRDFLLYADCMRAHGVPAFPDPKPGGGIQLGPGVDPSAPAFQAARATCRKLLPAGMLGAGTTTHPSSGTLERFVRIAECMRRHGVPDFPDPRTSVPSTFGGAGVISDIEGVIFVFPAATIDLQSPAFTRAAAACGFPTHNH